MSFRHILKAVAIPALYGSGLLRLMGRLGHRQCRIALNYHNVDPRVFKRHVLFLKEYADVVSIDAFLARLSGHNAKPRVTITFDDGYASFIQDIVPMLRVFRLPATWFVPTAFVGTQEVFWFDRLHAAIMLSPQHRLICEERRWTLRPWNRTYVSAAVTKILKQAETARRTVLAKDLLNQLGEPTPRQLQGFQLASADRLRCLDHDLITLGSHSHTHAQLTQLSEAELARELQTSKQLLELWTERPVQHFAFPSGDYDDRVIEGIRTAGYQSAWTTEPRLASLSDFPYRLPRVAIDDHAPVSILSAKMTPLIHRMGVL